MLPTSHFGGDCRPQPPASCRGPASSQGLSYQPAKVAMRAERHPGILLGLPGEQRELAYALLFLTSDESAYVTGAILRIDAGLLT